MANRKNEIRYRGKKYTVLQRMRVGDQTYLVLERLGSSARPCFRVYEPGVVGEMRCLHLLPSSRATVDRLDVLSKATLPHANLPVILKTQRRKEDIAVLTKWIDGPTLSDYLQDCRNGREPWPSVLITVNLIRGLAFTCQILHERLGVVHGDLHPANLILCRHTKRLVPIDFGSAWRVEQTRLRAEGDGIVRSYAAPEIAGSDGNPGFRSDQFSVMAICYELLTGKLPYDGLGGKAAQFLRRTTEATIAFEGPSHLLKQADNLPGGLAKSLDQLLEQSLQLAPENRFLSGREWLAEIGSLATSLQGATQLSRSNRWLLTQFERLFDLFVPRSK